MANRGAHVAYLVNRYPAPSHSFIRREIAAVEAAGVKVSRYSIRAAPDALPDSRDSAERDGTICVLAQGAAAILGATLIEAITRPGGFLRAAHRAWTMAQAAPTGRWRQLAYLAEAAWLCRDWRRRKITHVHAHFGTNPAAVARLARAWGGSTYSFTVHGPDEFDAPQAIDLAGKIADAAFVVAISSYGRSQLMRWADPVTWPKIEIVRCGVDETFLAESADPPPDLPVLCCVARLGPQKGLAVLIDAIALVVPEHPDLRVVIVGDGPLRNVLETQAASLGVSLHIVWTGVASGEEVRDHIRSARAFILPSFAEGLPVVLMEALALGRPVITTWVAGIPELIDAEVGWLVSPGDPVALAAAMRAALGTPVGQLTAMGSVGHSRVAASHNSTINGAQMAGLFDRVATR